MGKSFIAKLISIVFVLQGTFATGQLKQDTLFALASNEDFIHEVATSMENFPIVMLGEPTHGEGNILELKARLVKVLVEKHGFSVVAFESGIYDLWKANAYIKEGKSRIPSLKDGLFTIWSCSEQMIPMFSMLEKWGDNVSVVGFDTQFSGEYASESFSDDFERISKASGITEPDFGYWREVCESMSEVYDVPAYFDLDRFKKISMEMIRVAALIEQNETNKILMQIIKNVVALASDYHNNSPTFIDQKDWKAENSNNRDRQMAYNLIFLRSLYPGRKIICWGASAHFAKGFERAASNELNNYIPMGKILSDSLGKEKVFSVAFIGAVGRYGFSSNVKVVPDAPLTIEDELAKSKVPHAYVVLSDNTGSFSSKAIEFVPVTNNWNDTFDALLYTREVIPNTINCQYFSRTSSVKTRRVTAKRDAATAATRLNLKDKSEYIQSVRSTKIFHGKVIDAKSHNPVPFAYVVYKDSNIGSMADDSGTFQLYSSPLQDTLLVSSVGYKNLKISKAALRLDEPNFISLSPEVIVLKEVSIVGKRLTAIDILKQVIAEFDSNYIQSKYTSQVRLRKISKSTSGVIQTAENVFEITDMNGYSFSSPYPGRNEIERKLQSSTVVRIDSATLDTLSKDTTPKPIRGAVAFIDLLNYRKNSFLNPDKWKAFEFTLTDVLESENNEIYKLVFRCKRPSHFNTLQLAPIEYWGELYVDSASHAVIKFVTFTRQNKEKVWQGERHAAFTRVPEWFNKTIVTYKKFGRYYFLDQSQYFSNWDTENGFIQIESLRVNMPLHK